MPSEPAGRAKPSLKPRREVVLLCERIAIVRTLTLMGNWKALSALAILAVLAAGCGSGDSDTSEATTVAPADEAPASETTETQAPVDEGPEPTCAYAGTNDTGDMQVDLTFTNTLGEVNDLEVTYALLDSEGGTRIFTDTPIAQWGYFPTANEQFRVTAEALEPVPPGADEATIACTVLGIEESTSLSGFQRASDADTCTVLGTDPSGGIRIEVAVASPYEETTNVQTWWALQAPGQVRFDVDTEVTDLVGAGESYRITPDFGRPKPAWVGDSAVTCTVLGFWDQGT